MGLALAVTVNYSVSTSPFFHMRLHKDMMVFQRAEPSRDREVPPSKVQAAKTGPGNQRISFAAGRCFIDLCSLCFFVQRIKGLIGSILLNVVN